MWRGNDMCRTIMSIPNQKFSLMVPPYTDGKDIFMNFSEECTGTIYLVAGMIDGDEDALVAFGLPDGMAKKEATVAFWEHFETFNMMWKRMVKEKQKKGEAH
jgi:hypothetical protein